MPRFATTLQINLSPLASRDAPARSPDPPEAMENGRRMVFSGAPAPGGLSQMPGPPRPVPRNPVVCCGLPGLTAPNLSRSPVQSSEGITSFSACSSGTGSRAKPLVTGTPTWPPICHKICSKPFPWHPDHRKHWEFLTTAVPPRTPLQRVAGASSLVCGVKQPDHPDQWRGSWSVETLPTSCSPTPRRRGLPARALQRSDPQPSAAPPMLSDP